jgi:RimJ/RimL family protein N-acetyltransferase
MIHATQSTRAGLAVLRDLAESDLEHIVRYWHDGGADLEFLGIDPAKLGKPEDTHARYVRAVRNGDPAQPNIAFTITLDGEFVGYTLLNQYAPESNYSHWHIIAPENRAGGFSSALYPHRIKMYFDTTAIARLIHQTRTRNIGVNRMLDKFVPIAETAYVEKPDGVAGPGEFHMRHVRREDVPRLFARAAELGLR